MGITIVQKSDLSVRKKDPKIALVLAGGAITGGAFKLGGLKALDDFLVNKKTTEFDTYVGLSAGAVLAAPLAAGISPAEMLKSLNGESSHFTRFGLSEFYNPNIEDFITRPAQFAARALTFVPGTVADLLTQLPTLARNLYKPFLKALQEPSLSTLEELLTPIGEVLAKRRGFPSPLDYLPSGIFDNASIERYLRHNFKAAGLPNDFRNLHRATKRELYIGAMNLDTAERVVFGHDEDTSVTVSEAVQASTALPGFYKPARINGVDYVDGGVRRTANIDVAIEKGCDLIICYNPFRPFLNRVDDEGGRHEYFADGRYLADRGLKVVVNQVFRTLLHSRLKLGIQRYLSDDRFQGDIVLLEPRERDANYFATNPLAFWKRAEAVEHGFQSVRTTVEQNFEQLQSVFQRYGLHMDRTAARRRAERARVAQGWAGESGAESEAESRAEAPSLRLVGG